MANFVEALERRAHPRVRRQLPCKLLAGGQGRSGTVRNLSAEGVCVATHAHLPHGAPVVVTLESPQGRPLVLAGRVRRSRAVALSLSRVAEGELALHLENSSPSYVRWLEGALGGAA